MTNRSLVRKRRMTWSRNAVAAKALQRIERAESPLPDQPRSASPVPARVKTATVSIRCGKDSLSFRVFRWDEKKLCVRGQARAASWIGKVVAVALEGILCQ